MNYCAASQGRVFHDSDPVLSDWRPTGYDQLGIEILYPKTGALELACESGCLGLGAGKLLRNNGTLQDSWSGRGALDWWTSELITWKKGVTVLATAEMLSASQVGANGTVTFTAINKWNNKTITGEDAVEVSDGKWTAIAIAAL
jgi:hypothetical protein